MVLKVLFFLSFFTTYLFAHTGEYTFEHYYGPNDPMPYIDHYRQEYIFQEDRDEEYYFNKRIQKDIFLLKEFFETEFQIGLECSDEKLKKSVDNYRYLVRLLVLSYLFESLRSYEYTTKALGIKGCSVNWNDFLKSCRPKSERMQIFKKNLPQLLNNLSEVVVPFEKSTDSAKRKWYLHLKKKSPQDLIQYRLLQNCYDKSCKKELDKNQVEKKIKSFCHQDLNLANKICSEEDRLFGVSYRPEVYSLLLKTSHLSPHYQMGCFKRYVENNNHREAFYSQLSVIFPYLYENLQSKNNEPLTGNLFILGALKEYFDKGLKDIFNVEKKKGQKKVISKQEKSEPPKFEKIILPDMPKKAKKKKKKKQKKKVISKKAPKRSAFYIATEFRKKFDLDKARVDMSQLKYDYIFNLEQESKFRETVNRFSRVQSLKDMHELDKLGTRKAPLPLRFLKFLIDKQMHQGLYNIIQVLGDSFYVYNDIDKGIKNSLVRVRIINNQKTQFKWVIEVLP
jgi:hypothetical protein